MAKDETPLADEKTDLHAATDLVDKIIVAALDKINDPAPIEKKLNDTNAYILSEGGIVDTWASSIAEGFPGHRALVEVVCLSLVVGSICGSMAKNSSEDPIGVAFTGAVLSSSVMRLIQMAIAEKSKENRANTATDTIGKVKGHA